MFLVLLRFLYFMSFFCFWTLSSSSFRMLMIFDFGHTKVVNLNYLLPMHTHTQKARHCNTLHVCATELNKKKTFFSISVITEKFSHFVASDKKNSTFLFVCYFVVTFNEIMCMCVSFLVCVQWNQTSNNTMIVSVKRKT